MDRHSFLVELHRRIRPRNYLEIGVSDGKSLTLSRVPSIGVDPAFRVTRPIHCDLQLVRATSDAFFGRRDPIRHLRSVRNPIRNMRRGRPWLDHWRGGTTLDLAFIDGLHLFEYALRDFMNVERYSRWSSVIVFDDVLPRNVDEAARERHTGDWAGDVYKLVAVLDEFRPDLTILPLDTQPTGVMVVLGADPGSTVLRDRYDELLERWIQPDPQDVPAEVIGRLRAADPHRVLASDVWDELPRRRHASRARAYADVRRRLTALRP